METLHKLDLRGNIGKNWRDYHNEYIDIWDCRIEFLPIYESSFSLGTTACLEYMHWFRVSGKPNLLSVESRSEGGAVTGLSLALTQQVLSMSTQHLDQFTLLIHVYFTNPVFFSQAPHCAPPQHFVSTPLVSMFFGASLSSTFYAPILSMVTLMAAPRPSSMQSSAQPLSCGVEDTQWEARIVPHSSTKKGYGDEDKVEGKDEEDKDDDYDDEEKPTPPLIHKNLTRNRQPPPYGTHSARRC
ncbi:hypothetical protein Goklo_025514 [Gossypium klotzschianum]|uniref:Uncharacterized protein n=1 Tax=Gossypium klotzschianum TaxID=34286 RepID=A0A7J8W6F9_9ROSI|nr:hypothetical protein [Gossypium klotzschianum]